MKFGQQRLPVGWIRWAADWTAIWPSSGVSHPRWSLAFLRSLSRQQPFQLAVAHNQSHDLCPRRIHEARAQCYIVPKVVDADGQSIESDCRRGRNQFRRRQFFWLFAEAEDGKSRHT
jgi:hypothetical protein